MKSKLSWLIKERQIGGNISSNGKDTHHQRINGSSPETSKTPQNYSNNTNKCTIYDITTRYKRNDPKTRPTTPGTTTMTTPHREYPYNPFAEPQFEPLEPPPTPEPKTREETYEVLSRINFRINENQYRNWLHKHQLRASYDAWMTYLQEAPPLQLPQDATTGVRT